MAPRTGVRRSQRGLTLLELVVTTAVLGLATGLVVGLGQRQWAGFQLEQAARRLALGIERGRVAAERSGQPCALELQVGGWRAVASDDLGGCNGAETPLHEGVAALELQLGHTFDRPVRFSANGLAIDGGTAVLAVAGTNLVRCVVMSPPLGVARVGRYAGAFAARPVSSSCLPDATL